MHGWMALCLAQSVAYAQTDPATIPSPSHPSAPVRAVTAPSASPPHATSHRVCARRPDYADKDPEWALQVLEY